MTIDDAIRALGNAGDQLPVEAMQWCLDNWDEAAPRLLKLLDAAAQPGPRSEENDAALFFAVHLFGEQQDISIFPALCNFLCDGVASDLALGDAITVTLARILISTYDGDPGPLKAVIECADADEFARDAALNALSYLAGIGRISEDEMRAYLTRLRQALPQEESFVWVGWITAIANLGYADLTPAVEDVLRREFVPDLAMDFGDFKQQLERALRDPTGMGGFLHDQIEPFVSAIDELESWYAFSEHAADETDAEPVTDPFWADPGQPYVNPNRGLGRNDPCPCGSGRKYKKCCLNGGEFAV